MLGQKMKSQPVDYEELQQELQELQKAAQVVCDQARALCEISQSLRDAMRAAGTRGSHKGEPVLIWSESLS